jgi:hypothetical protein
LLGEAAGVAADKGGDAFFFFSSFLFFSLLIFRASSFFRAFPFSASGTGVVFGFLSAFACYHPRP